MQFTGSEIEMICQYTAPTKAGTIAMLKEAAAATGDTLTRVITENTIKKLQKIPEPECSAFLADTRARFAKGQASPVKRKLAEAKAQAREPLMQGHDLTGAERFLPETRHMVVLDVLTSDSPVGYKGERYRFFLSDRQYENARASGQRGEIRIRKHAAVTNGKLHPDRRPGHER